jgi:hypothetical protein
MTISDLIDYLQQFPPDTRVVLDDDDDTLHNADVPFIELAYLDYRGGTK